MPYFRDQNEEQDDPQNPGSLRLSSTTDQAGLSGGDPAGTGRKNTGSHFQNLDNYLSTNDAQGFGQQLGSRVQGEINQGRNVIDQNVGQVRNQINQNGTVANPDQIQSAVRSPESFDPATYQSWLHSQYTGPSSIQDSPSAANAISGAVSNAQTKAQQTGTESGRFSLLDSYFGRPNYTFGEKSLDNLLVQRGGGLNNSRALQNQATQLGTVAQQQENSLVNDAARRAGQVEQTRNQARNSIGITENGTIGTSGAIPDFMRGVDQRVADLNGSRTGLRTRVGSDLSDDQVSPETLSALGIDPGTPLYNLDLNRYLVDPAAVSKENVATGADYNRYLALSQLAGVDPTYLTDATRAQSGQYGSDSVFNKQGLMNDLLSTKSTYETQKRNLSQQIGNKSSEYDVLAKNLQDLAGNGFAGQARSDLANRLQALSQEIEALQGQSSQLDQQFRPTRSLNNVPIPQDQFAYNPVQEGRLLSGIRNPNIDLGGIPSAAELPPGPSASIAAVPAARNPAVDIRIPSDAELVPQNVAGSIARRPRY